MIRAVRVLLLGLLLVLLAAETGAPAEPFHERVNRAIDRGVAWLKTRPVAGAPAQVVSGLPAYGDDSSIYTYPHGVSALTALTLLKCGVPPDHPSVRRCFDVLRKKRVPDSTYEITVLILAIEARTNRVKRERKLEAVRRMRAKPGEEVNVDVRLPRVDRRWMEELTKALLERWGGGGWRYGLNMDIPGAVRDMSNTQMAVLALYVASRCGIDIPWRTVQQTMLWTLDQQEAKGPAHERFVPETNAEGYAAPVDHARGWSYVKGSKNAREARVTGTMTTGGVLVLVAGRAILRREKPKLVKVHARKVERGIRDGLAWLDRNWRVHTNPPGRASYHLMYLYGVERVADLLRVHLVGNHDWYREGAEWLLVNQKPDGRWEKKDTHQPADLLNTCFALLFLERGSLVVNTR